MDTTKTRPTKNKISPNAGKHSSGKLFAFLGSFRGVLALVVVLVVGAFYSPKNETGWPIFLTVGTQADILYEFAQVGLLAAGMTFVILSGGIDLSVGSVLGFVAMMFSLFYIGFGWNPVLASAVAILIGAACGLVNGLLVTQLRIQPFVATLAMMVAARGGAELVSGNTKIQPGGKTWYAITASDRLPFYEWMNSSIMNTGLRPMTLIFLFAIVASFIVIKYTSLGRQLYAIGGNEQAARLSGINVRRTKIAAYVVCAASAALAGICNAAKQGLGYPQAGLTLELDAIAAVVIGGTSLTGGSGSMFYTLLGTLVIADITKILSIKNVEHAYRLIAKGGLIVAAVLIQQRRSR